MNTHYGVDKVRSNIMPLHYSEL
uniref:Uncharacterized protein n=1 Tax=Anguilla anguilla TaxID=7936 RepID=A0A0E9V1R3_ANGAN